MTPTPTARHEEEARRAAHRLAAGMIHELAPGEVQAIASAIAEARAAGRAEAAEQAHNCAIGEAYNATFECDEDIKELRVVLLHMLKHPAPLAAAPQKERAFAPLHKEDELMDECDTGEGSEGRDTFESSLPLMRRSEDGRRGYIQGHNAGRLAGLQEAARMAREEADFYHNEFPKYPLLSGRAEALRGFADKLTALAASGAGESERQRTEVPAQASATASAGSPEGAPFDSAPRADCSTPPSASSDEQLIDAFMAERSRSTFPAAEREARRERARIWFGDWISDADDKRPGGRLLADFAEAELARADEGLKERDRLIQVLMERLGEVKAELAREQET